MTLRESGQLAQPAHQAACVARVGVPAPPEPARKRRMLPVVAASRVADVVPDAPQRLRRAHDSVSAGLPPLVDRS